MANARRCPFYGCSKMIDPAIFACREHWPDMEDKDRFRIWQLYTDYLEGKLHITDLVRQQAEIMLKTTSQTVPGAARTATDAEVDLAKKVKEYVHKRKEYTTCNIGFADKKKRLGMELNRLETAIAKMADAILHPPQVQNSLFDNPADEQAQQMPD